MNWIEFFVWVFISEIALSFIFHISSKSLESGFEDNQKDQENSFGKSSILKGLVERSLLLLGSLTALPQVFIVFGALKLGTRLKPEKQCRISNDYFLFGNFTSLIAVLLYRLIWIGLDLPFLASSG